MNILTIMKIKPKTISNNNKKQKNNDSISIKQKCRIKTKYDLTVE